MAVKDKEKAMENVFAHLNEEMKIIDSRQSLQEDELGVKLDERVSLTRPLGHAQDFKPPTLEERSNASPSLNQSMMSLEMDAHTNVSTINLEGAEGNVLEKTQIPGSGVKDDAVQGS